MRTPSVEAIDEAVARPNSHGQPRVFVQGERGSGKRTGIRDALNRSAWIYLESEADPYKIPYRPIVNALVAFIEQARKTREHKAVAMEVAAALFRLVPVVGPLGESVESLVERAFIDRPKGVSEYGDVLFQIKGAVRAIARREPTVLVFHGVEQFDATTLGMLADMIDDDSLRCGYVLSSNSDILATDPEGFSHFRAELLERTFVHVKAQLFRVEDTATYASLRLGGRIIAPGEADRLQKLTGGNPLFLRELLEFLLSEQMINDSSGPLLRLGSDPRAMPMSVRAIIDIRLAALQSNLREVVDVASLLGTPFPTKPIAGVLRVEHLIVLRRLREIQRLHALIEEKQGTHSFTHEMVRAHVSDSLGDSLAREQNLLLAEYLESNPVDEDNEYHLYHHYAQAGRAKEALDHLVAAAIESRRRVSHADAAARFRTAAQLARSISPVDMRRVAELEVEHGVALVDAGAYAAATDALQSTWLNTKDPRLKSRALLYKGLAEYFSSTYSQASDTLIHLIQEEELAPDIRCRAYLTLASVLYHDGKWEDSRAAYLNALATPYTSRSSLQQATKRANMFYMPELALPRLEALAADLEGSDEDDLIAEVAHNIGCNLLLLRRLDEASERFGTALRYFERVASHKQAYPRNNLAIIHILRGDFVEARRLIDLVKVSPMSDFDRISALCHEAAIYAVEGKAELGLRILEDARRDAGDELILREAIDLNAAWMHVGLGKHKEALAFLLRSPPRGEGPWLHLKRAQAHRLAERIAEHILVPPECFHQSAADRLERTGRLDAWIYRELDFAFSEVWFWE